MKRFLIALILAVATPAVAGTNSPAIADYPAPTCVNPGPQPQLPPNVVQSYQGGKTTINAAGKDLKLYNERVDAYNTGLHEYTTCMDAYVSNAQSDINAIRDKVNKAVANSKAP